MKHISERLNEGFTVDDMKKAVDIKCSKWLDDPYMTSYLRPETLFGTKMESYLNESFTPLVDPVESLERELEELFNSGDISPEDREAIKRGEWQSKPWKDDMRAMEIAR
ncbi:unnamed protein product, partial [marine sediment metagenome]